MSYNKNILSIENDDDNKNYEAFSEYLADDTNRKKKKTVAEIEEMGDTFLKEIDKKKIIQDGEKLKHIKYIIKHSQIHSKDELMLYDINDVRDIYLDIKKQKESKFKNFFYFIFNI